MSGSSADKKEKEQKLQRDTETVFFANLCLDSDMLNSFLEGQSVYSAITHLNTFLQALKKQKIQEDYILQLLGLEQKRSTVTLNSKSLVELGKDIQFLEEVDQKLYRFNLNPLAENIVKRLIKRSHVFLPGGWASHAMIYQLVIDTENNRLLFLVSNSGGGLSYHPRVINKKGNKARYENQIAYQIPLDKLVPAGKTFASIKPEQRKKLIAFIQELLCAQKHSSNIGKNQSGAKYVYEVLFEKIKSLGGERIASELLSEHYKPKLITGQRSGTCTQKSLNQLIKQYFPIKKDYKSFIYAYKLHSLKTYIDYLKKRVCIGIQPTEHY